MKKNLLLKLLIVAIALIAGNFDASAKWELLKQHKSPYCMHITPTGAMLLADYVFDNSGGIYRSEDGGKTWTKTDAPDYAYGKIITAGDYIIATGKACRVARSADDGKTWEVTSYASALEDIKTPAGLESTICYAATMHNGRLYVGDYGGGGVLYTDDFGEEWHRTHIESLQYSTDNSRAPKPSVVTENIYNLVSYKDGLYAFGIYFVFKYDEANDRWITLRDDSNFLTQSTVHKGQLVCGRTIVNQSTEFPYLLTFDGETWGEIARPAGLNDNNTRCLGSDDNGLYVGMQQTGFYCTFNDGETWVSMSEGLPAKVDGYPDEIQHLIDVEMDDTYVYLVVYDSPFNDFNIDGIYRITKAELEGLNASAIGIETDKLDIRFDGSFLHVGECTALTVSDLSGRTINATAVNGKVDFRGLTPGVYIYSVAGNDKKVAGKFIKK